MNCAEEVPKTYKGFLGMTSEMALFVKHGVTLEGDPKMQQSSIRFVQSLFSSGKINSKTLIPHMRHCWVKEMNMGYFASDTIPDPIHALEYVNEVYSILNGATIDVQIFAG